MPGQKNSSPSIDYDDCATAFNRPRLGEVRNIKGASWERDMGLVAEAICGRKMVHASYLMTYLAARRASACS